MKKEIKMKKGTKMKKVFLTMSMLLALGLNASEASNIPNATKVSEASKVSKLPAYSTKFNKNADPYKDLTMAMKKAKVSGKKILIMVGGDWCRWCGTFDNFLEDNDKIRESFYNSFEVLRVYYGKGINKKTQSFLKQFPKLKATPHFYILDKISFISN